VTFLTPVPPIDSFDEQDIHPALVAANAKRPIDAIITTSEAALSAVALEAAFFGTVYPDPERLQTAIFKDNCRQLLSDAGVRSTAFETISEAVLLAGGKPQKVSVPFVIKPTRVFGKEFSAICIRLRSLFSKALSIALPQLCGHARSSTRWSR
jgi:biotin carboxylase